MAAYLLTMPFLQAFAGVLIPVALLCMIVLKAPDLVVLATFLPLIPTLVTIGIEAVGLQQFGRDFAVRVRFRDYVRLVVGTLPYQLLLAAAAVRATVREVRGVGTWEKTSHVGAHRTFGPPSTQETVR